MKINLTIETEDKPSLRKAAALLAFLLQSPPCPTDITERPIEDVIADVIPFRSRGDDQGGRLSYLYGVADAGDEGLTREEALKIFEGNAQALGGTRSSIQKAWVKTGGTSYGQELIYDLREGRQALLAVARDAVKERAFQAMGESLREMIRELQPIEDDK